MLTLAGRGCTRTVRNACSMACTHGCVRDASAPRLVNTTVDTDTRRQLVHMRGGHALWRSCMRAGQSCRACARLRRRVGALHPNSDLAGPSCTPIASNRLRSLPSKQANLAIEGASLSFLGRIRARSSHNVSRFLGATVFTGVGYKVRHPALQPFSEKPRTPTVAPLSQIGLCDPVKADS